MVTDLKAIGLCLNYALEIYEFNEADYGGENVGRIVKPQEQCDK